MINIINCLLIKNKTILKEKNKKLYFLNLRNMIELIKI